MKISCLIIDDEPSAREGLHLLLQDYSDIELVAMCKNGVEAIDAIMAHKPDLILLDIQMQLINGFEVLATVPKPWPQTIFITAHDEFAIKAFEVNAVDYLLKPFSDERFSEALDRARQSINLAKDQQLTSLIAAGKHKSPPISAQSVNDRLVIKSEGNIHLINLADIVYVEAYDYYVKIHTVERYYLLRDTMKNMEIQLKGQYFIRIHKSYIVRTECIKSIVKSTSGECEVVLSQGMHLKVSRSCRSALMDKLDG